MLTTKSMHCFWEFDEIKVLFVRNNCLTKKEIFIMMLNWKASKYFFLSCPSLYFLALKVERFFFLNIYLIILTSFVTVIKSNHMQFIHHQKLCSYMMCLYNKTLPWLTFCNNKNSFMFRISLAFAGNKFTLHTKIFISIYDFSFIKIFYIIKKKCR